MEGKVNEQSPGGHFIHIARVETVGIIVPDQFVVYGKNTANRGSELKIIQVKIDSKADLIVVGIGCHPEYSVVVILRVIFIARQVYGSGNPADDKRFKVIDPGGREL